ncbi:MAG TPA: hypothetical protein VEJ18_11900, partial [Planctomycetota bacterium]|nr:hypothetical protein [Planctomycetota bacterium]
MTPLPEFDALAQEWLDGTLDEAGQARLLEILREDPTARERLEAYAWLHHHVDEALGGETPDLSDRVVQEIEVREGERIRDQVLARVLQPLRLRAKTETPRRGRVWVVAGIAAAFLVSLTALLFRASPPAPAAPTAR